MQHALPAALAALPFTTPVALTEESWREHVTRGPAVYRIRAWDLERDAPRAIPRLGGVDEMGIMDIGESGRGRTRVADFLGAAQGKPRSHRAGWDFYMYGVAEVVPLEALRVDALAVDDKDVAEALELALLEDYRWRYKDRPPLNGSAGKYRKVAAWLERRGIAARDGHGWLNILTLLRAAGFTAAR